jgi:hypothetical protein
VVAISPEHALRRGPLLHAPMSFGWNPLKDSDGESPRGIALGMRKTARLTIPFARLGSLRGTVRMKGNTHDERYGGRR